MPAHTVERVERDTGERIAPKRGDLAAHVELTRYAYVGRDSEERLNVRLGVVTSVSRDGRVLAAWWPFSGDESERRPVKSERLHGGAIHYVPAASVDVDAILAEYMARRYPNAPHSSQILPFEDNSDARALIVAHKR